MKVSDSALVKRINRKLVKDGLRVRKCRDISRGHNTLGDYYVDNIYDNCIDDCDIDLRVWAEDLGVISPRKFKKEAVWS